MNTNKKRNIKITALFILSSFVAAHLLTWLLPDIFDSWNSRIVDQLFLYRSSSKYFRPYYDDTIVHVDLNNTSIRQLNQYYLNRSHHARVISNLSKMKAAALLYDFIFAAPSNEAQDRALIKATSAADNVYFGMAFELARAGEIIKKTAQSQYVKQYLAKTKWKAATSKNPAHFYKGTNPLITFPALSAVSRGSGFLNLKADRDGVFRRVPLLVKYEDAFYPSLPFRVICDYLGVGPDKIKINPGKSIILKGVQKPGELNTRDIVIPIDRYGNLIVNFIGPWERMKHYNFSDILKASADRDELELWAEELSGKIVAVSEVTTGSADIGPVPTDNGLPLSGLHAQVMHTILTKSFIKEFSYPKMLLVEILILLSIFFMSIRFTSLPFSIGSISIGIGYVIISAILFLYAQIILHLIRPLSMAVFAVGAILIYRYFKEEKEKAVLKKSFESYFPAAVVKKLMKNPEMIATRGEKKELTILFSDIVNFTGYSADKPPGQVQKLLNEYFEAMTEIVFKHEGTVDKFMGDGLMVFFGDPEPQPDHALRSVRAAIEMQQKVEEMRTELKKQEDLPLQIRIGINTGMVVVGNMGSEKRLSYTVIGSAVNLAQRLESNAPVGGILISERTNELVKDKIETRPLGSVQVKGFVNPVMVSEVKF